MLSQSSVEPEYQLNATRGVRLDDLRFPFPSHWRTVRGIQRLSTSKDTGLTSHPELRLKAEQLFGIQMTPDSSGAVTINLSMDFGPTVPSLEPNWVELGRVYLEACGVGPSLARSMFRMPNYQWKLGETASALGVRPRSLQMALFREGYSFDATLRRCRRLHTLLEQGDPIAGLRVARGCCAD